MINVNQITSQLAKMPDQALQKYAALNKNDPYILALAVAESNRRKEMRQAAQGAQGMMPQPKVADQAVQSMAAAQPMPEEMGIGRLPAGDMNFADGGIVAFADGGEVERYNGTTGSLTGGSAAFSRFLQATGQMSAYINGTPAERAAIQQAAQMAMQGPVQSAAVAPVATPTAASAAAPAAQATSVGSSLLRNSVLGAIPYIGYQLSDSAAQTLSGATPEQRAQFYSNPMMGAMSGDAGLAAAILNQGSATEAKDAVKRDAETKKKTASALEADRARNMAAVANADFTQPAMANDPRLLGPTPAAETVRASKAPSRAPGAPGAPGAPRTQPTPGAAATTAPATTELDPNALFETAMTRLGKEKRPEEGLLEALNKERIDAAKAEKAGVEALNAKFADAFKGRRERLDTREAELGKMKDQNFGLALLQAGAAMMSTPGSLGTAIGRGVQTGSQQYVAGIDKLNAAKDKLADARDRLDDLQLNRDEMSAREILKAENKIRDTAISGKENMIKFVMERDKVNRETAAKIVDNQMQLGLTQLREQGAMDRTLIQERGQNARTNAQIAAQSIPPEMRGAMSLGTGNTPQEKYLSGMKLVQEATADKTGLAMAKLLAQINADNRKADPTAPLVTAADLLRDLQQISSLMYPKVGDNQPTRARPGP